MEVGLRSWAPGIPETLNWFLHGELFEASSFDVISTFSYSERTWVPY